ncbi:MAG: hypothetical protein RJA59_352 [Pseudomonadota bacterium]
MALSAGFVAVGVARSSGDPYSRWILLGLVLSAAGDAFLLSDERRAFLGGLGCFLLAHLAYAAAFAPLSRPGLPALAGIALATAAVLAWLWPRLGSMRIPVVGYAVAIGLMLWLASGVHRALVPVGALLFWLSDLTVAKRRFGPRSPLDRAVGWPLYFAGQYLLAFSLGAG